MAGVTHACPLPAAPARDRVLAAVDAARAACAAALGEGSGVDRHSPFRGVVHIPSGARMEDRTAAALARLQQYARSEMAAAAALGSLPASGPARAIAVREDLLHGAMAALARLPDLAVAPSVKVRFCDVFRMFCDMRGDEDARFRPDLGFHGCALAACALLTRFPAGQLDWQVSGLPRSYLMRMPYTDLPRVARAIVRDLGGLRPCFVAHMGVRRYPLLFVEAESHRSYHRIAQSMALQPEVRGLLMEAWFHSPETIRVSPHLAWTNRTPLANGATLTNLGPAPPYAGFLEGSPDRQRLYESGDYRPTIGLIIWPRQPLLAWAAAHPEFGVEADTG
jgi:hypothetical protein